ncbi:MAG TPA: carboxypeptidase regulatory-like domain-containing protein [Bryobacteraceae bacterium]|nr:carboxypeptidase regulatory-like domain-containing protein [Bryobacteraceae bacterium]
MKRLSTTLLLGVFFCLILALGLFAQATSQISGTVKDATGAAVPGATITVTQTDTGVTRAAESDANGVYSLPSLPLGPYRMEVKKEGFTTYVGSGITLQVDTAPTIDPVLKVGAVSESVQVEAAAAMVETHSTGVGQVVNSQDVVELPLNGRQITQLITLAGASNTVQYGFGQAPSVGNLVSSKNYPNEALVSVGGGMLNGTTYLLDGGTHNDPFNNLNLPLPFPDAIQEFKVETSSLPAEYGQHSAGAVNVVSRSGSNEFHGDAFEFVRNGYFNARDFFAPTNDNLKRNQFGGTIGGPIKKNKLFFFAGYQGTLIRSAPAAAPAVVPTAAELTGDFRAYESQCFVTGPQTLKAPFVNNVLPQSLVSPQALAFASHFPVGPGPCGNVTYTQIANQDEHMGLAKVDYQISSKQSVFARYYGTHSLTPSSFTGTELSVQNAGTDDEVNSFVLGHTYIFSPNALNTFHATVDRSGVTKFQVPIVTPTDIGVQGIYIALPTFSNINITGDFSSAGGFATPGLVNTTTYQFTDDFSLIKGSHQMQFGANFIRPMQASTFCVYCNGLFTFSGQLTGSAMADFVSGSLGSFTQLNLSHDNEKWAYIGLYAQDNWKINSRLTLNYGIRWEPYLNGRIVNNKVTHFNMADFLANVHSTIYPNAPAGTLFPGDKGFDTGGRPNFTTWNNWAPRVGLAWDPSGNGKTLIRASWGIFYDMPQSLFYYNYSTEPLWGEAITLTAPPGGFANPWLGYPGGSPFPTSQNTSTTYPTAAYYETVPLHVQNTYVEQWNLTLQKQMGASWLLKASYLGNNTIHLWTDQELNPAVYVPGNCVAGQFGLAKAGPCSTIPNTQARRLFTQLNPSQGPFYGTVESLDDGGTASYNALILSAEHRFSSHYSMLANYTWSHCIADPQTTELSGPIYTDPNNRRSDRGNCPFVDIHHNFNLSAVLQSPHYSNRYVQWFAGDWQLSPIVGIHSGSYFGVTTGVDNALTGIGAQRPNQILSNAYCANKSINCWMNAKAFASPAPGTLGDLGVSNLEGPGYFDVDLSLSRQFRIKEKQSFEIRAETFNIENRANFLNPGTVGIAGGAANSALNSSTFGKIQADVAPRIMQFAVKYNF